MVTSRRVGNSICNASDTFSTGLGTEEDGLGLTSSSVNLFRLVGLGLKNGRLLVTFGNVDGSLART